MEICAYTYKRLQDKNTLWITSDELKNILMKINQNRLQGSNFPVICNKITLP